VFEVDTDREGVGAAHLIPHGDLTQVMVVPEHTEDGVQEVLRVLVGMKADQIRAQHAGDDLALPAAREQPEDFVRGKRDVEEEADRRLRSPGAQHARHQQ
jgi:hypothetical protein